MMSRKILALLVVLLAGCQTQLDIREGDCSITMVEVDAKASTPVVGTVEADGWVLVQRGECPNSLIEMYKALVLGS